MQTDVLDNVPGRFVPLSILTTFFIDRHLNMILILSSHIRVAYFKSNYDTGILSPEGGW